MRLSELTKSLDRSQFACGNEALDDYFHKFVGQDVRNGLAKCYVALADDSDTILGYFTLSCWALDQRLLPEDKRRGRYLHLPVALLGRLAVSTSHQGLGIASALVEKALDITQTMPVGCAGLIVEPKPGLERFYERLQFHGLRDSEGRTFFVKLHGKKRISRLNLYPAGTSCSRRDMASLLFFIGRLCQPSLTISPENFRISTFKIHKDYEGRYMFGRTCFGIVVHDYNELAYIALDLSDDVRDEFREILSNLRKDNMGWDYIAYFPAYQWPEDLF